MHRLHLLQNVRKELLKCKDLNPAAARPPRSRQLKAKWKRGESWPKQSSQIFESQSEILTRTPRDDQPLDNYDDDDCDDDDDDKDDAHLSSELESDNSWNICSILSYRVYQIQRFIKFSLSSSPACPKKSQDCSCSVGDDHFPESFSARFGSWSHLHVCRAVLTGETSKWWRHLDKFALCCCPGWFRVGSNLIEGGGSKLRLAEIVSLCLLAWAGQRGCECTNEMQGQLLFCFNLVCCFCYGFGNKVSESLVEGNRQIKFAPDLQTQTFKHSVSRTWTFSFPAGKLLSTSGPHFRVSLQWQRPCCSIVHRWGRWIWRSSMIWKTNM